MSELFAMLLYYGMAPTVLVFLGILIVLNLILAWAVVRLSLLMRKYARSLRATAIGAMHLTLASTLMSERISLLEKANRLADNDNAPKSGEAAESEKQP